MFQEISSQDATSWLFMSAVTFLFLWLVISRLRGPKLPPSPGISLPFFGHLFLVKTNPKEQFRAWGKQSGGMFSLRMGLSDLVVITDFELLKETLVRRAPIFSDRSDKFITDICPFIKEGIILSSGQTWKDQRTLAVTILRDLGVGNNASAERIAIEADHLSRKLASFTGAVVNIKSFILVAVCNVISAVIFNRRFDYEDEHVNELLAKMEEHERLGYSVGKLNYFPFLKYLPFNVYKVKRFTQTTNAIIEQVRQFVEDVKTVYNPEVLDSFTAHYLKKMHVWECATALSDTTLLASIINLFVAGTDSTANTVEWAILYAVNYPRVQERIHQEILQYVGSERAPTTQDKKVLSYLRAFIFEVQRLACVAPFAVTHSCNKQVDVRGFTFPAGTQILVDLDAVHFNEDLWGDPLNFRPERFLDDDGNVVVKEEFIPFSMGRRKCMGKSLAEDTLFLFLSTLFQRFQFVPVDPESPPPVEESSEGISAPPHFCLRCLERVGDPRGR